MIETLLKQILKLPQLSLDELEILHKSISKLEFNSNAPQVESIKKLVEKWFNSSPYAMLKYCDQQFSDWLMTQHALLPQSIATNKEQTKFLSILAESLNKDIDQKLDIVVNNFPFLKIKQFTSEQLITIIHLSPTLFPLIEKINATQALELRKELYQAALKILPYPFQLDCLRQLGDSYEGSNLISVQHATECYNSALDQFAKHTSLQSPLPEQLTFNLAIQLRFMHRALQLQYYVLERSHSQQQLITELEQYYQDNPYSDIHIEEANILSAWWQTRKMLAEQLILFNDLPLIEALYNAHYTTRKKITILKRYQTWLQQQLADFLEKGEDSQCIHASQKLTELAEHLTFCQQLEAAKECYKDLYICWNHTARLRPKEWEQQNLFLTWIDNFNSLKSQSIGYTPLPITLKKVLKQKDIFQETHSELIQRLLRSDYPPEKAFITYSQHVCTLLVSLCETIMETWEASLTTHSISLVMAGSGARQEFTIDSDIECVILMNENYPHHYFGELFNAYLRWLNGTVDTYSHNGLKIDGAYLKQISGEKPALCCTPQSLAKWLIHTPHEYSAIKRALLQASLLYDSENNTERFNCYLKALNEFLPNQQTDLARHYLRQNHEDYQNAYQTLLFTNQPTTELIKKRLLQPILNGCFTLALSCGMVQAHIQETDHTFLTLLNRLVQSNIFSPAFANDLHLIWQASHRVRCEIYQNYPFNSENLNRLAENYISPWYHYVGHWLEDKNWPDSLTQQTTPLDPPIDIFLQHISQWNKNSDTPCHTENKITIQKFLQVTVARYQRHVWDQAELLHIFHHAYQHLHIEILRHEWLVQLEITAQEQPTMTKVLTALVANLAEIPHPSTGYRQAETRQYNHIYHQLIAISQPLTSASISDRNDKNAELSATLILAQAPNAALQPDERQLNTEVVTQLLESDGKLKPDKNASKSRHTVAAIEILLKNEIIRWHIKAEPDHPVKDFLIHTTRQRIIGHGSPPNLTGRLRVYRQDQLISDFVVLISPTIGENLASYFQIQNNPMFKLAVPLVQELAVVEYMLRPGDGRLENIQRVACETTEPSAFEQAYTFSLIDNNQYGIVPTDRTIENCFQKTLQMISALFSLPELKQAFAPESLQKLNASDIAAILQGILINVIEYQNNIKALFPEEKEIIRYYRADKNNPKFLQVFLPQGYFIDIAQAWYTLKNLIETSQTSFSPWDFFVAWDNEVASYYEKSINANNLNLMQRFAQVQRVKQSASSQDDCQRTLKRLPTETEIKTEDHDFSAKQALKELIAFDPNAWEKQHLYFNPKHQFQGKMIEMNTRQQKTMLDKISRYTWQYHRMSILHCSLFNDAWCDKLMKPSQRTLIELYLVEVAISLTTLQSVAVSCPSLISFTLKNIDTIRYIYASNLFLFNETESLLFPKLQIFKLKYLNNLINAQLNTPELTKLMVQNLKNLEKLLVKAPKLDWHKNMKEKDNPKLINFRILDSNGKERFISETAEQRDHVNKLKKAKTNSNALFFKNLWQSQTPSVEYDYLFDLLIIGDTCGKSTWLDRLTKDHFNPMQIITLNPEYADYICQMANKKIKLQIWDTSGQARMRSITSSHYRSAHLFIIGFSITSKESLNDIVPIWNDWIEKCVPPKAIKILVGMQCDLKDKRAVSWEEALAIAEQIGALRYIECSAVTGINVQGVAQEAAELCYKRYLYESDINNPEAWQNETLQFIPYKENVNFLLLEKYLSPGISFLEKQQPQTPKADYDYLFKLVIIGDMCGKTTWLAHLTNGRFFPTVDLTIGVEFETYRCQITNQKIKLQIWDTAGQSRFHSVTRSYFRAAHLIIIAFDIAQRETFDHIKLWNDHLEKDASPSILKILVGMRCDLEDKRAVSWEGALAVAEQIGALRYIECSAVTGINVQCVAQEAAELCFKRYLYENDINREAWRNETFRYIPYSVPKPVSPLPHVAQTSMTNINEHKVSTTPSVDFSPTNEVKQIKPSIPAPKSSIEQTTPTAPSVVVPTPIKKEEKQIKPNITAPTIETVFNVSPLVKQINDEYFRYKLSQDLESVITSDPNKECSLIKILQAQATKLSDNMSLRQTIKLLQSHQEQYSVLYEKKVELEKSANLLLQTTSSPLTGAALITALLQENSKSSGISHHYPIRKLITQLTPLEKEIKLTDQQRQTDFMSEALLSDYIHYYLGITGDLGSNAKALTSANPASVLTTTGLFQPVPASIPTSNTPSFKRSELI